MVGTLQAGSAKGLVDGLAAPSTSPLLSKCGPGASGLAHNPTAELAPYSYKEVYAGNTSVSGKGSSRR